MTADLHLEPRAAARIRAEIRRAGGNEVCFVAAVNDAGAVGSPRAVARGNRSAVVAAARDAEPGSLILHNHPSGDLSPSDSDLAIAADLYAAGLGFGVIDNDATALYVVVAPPRVRGLDLLDEDAIAAVLAPDGPVARAHPAYEDRPSQRDMARAIARSYNEGGITMAEAGTGTGKSAAYLVPAIEWAVRNRERTVISTNTINLQEQLTGKDLPFLRAALGLPFRYALVKGRSNYVSIRRARLAAAAADNLFDGAQRRDLDAVVSWLDGTTDGSLQDLAFEPAPEVWDEVASESDVCLRARCPHFESCFYQRARRDASAADVLVVNHHLLLSDIAVRRLQDNYGSTAVLPPYRRIVLDEAHNLEDAATSHLGVRVTRRSVHRLLARMERRGKGLLPYLDLRLRSAATDLLLQDALGVLTGTLRPGVERGRELAGELFARLEGILAGADDGVVRLADGFAADPDWNRAVSPVLEDLLIVLDSLCRGLARVRAVVMSDNALVEALAEQLVELNGVENRLAATAGAFRTVFIPGDEPVPLVRWLERRGRENAGGRPTSISASAAPVELSGLLREALFDRLHSTVLTSATLTTRDGFGFLRGRLGIASGVRVRESCHPSPFAFEEQTILALPSDMPDPRAEPRTYAGRVANVIEDHARLTDGGLFVLFTSYAALRATFAELQRRGTAGRWPLFLQGDEPRAVLLRRFTDAHRGILLGVASFWEGVDVPGEPLRGLIITKLPFRVPTEPLTAARIEAIDEAGGNSFRDFMLPHAALRLKQGFGRLVRSRADRGAVVILDPRILSRGYGRYFIDTLPPAPVVTGPWDTLRDELRTFYERTAPGPAAPRSGLTLADGSISLKMDV